MSQRSLLSVLVITEHVCNDLVEVLKRNGYSPRIAGSLEGTLHSLKGRDDAVLFLDYEAVHVFGFGIYSKVKQACPGCRIILLCDQSHREIVKQAMDMGAYCCVLEPYAEWEIITIVKRISDMPMKKGKPVSGGHEVREKVKPAKKKI